MSEIQEILDEYDIELDEETLELREAIDDPIDQMVEAFSQITNLKSLDIGHNHLTSLPLSIGNLQTLESLYLDMNRLTSLPESIGNLRSLKILDLDENQLTNLPETIGNLQNLEDLRVAHNKLTTLPDTIGNLRSLDTLYLEGNRETLESLPPSFSQLRLQNEPLNDMTQIRQLISRHTSDTISGDMSAEQVEVSDMLETTYGIRLNDKTVNLKEKLQGVPMDGINAMFDVFSIMPNLTVLDMGENNLQGLPESIGNLQSLERFDLQENQLTSLPQTIGNLQSLEYIDLDFNNLTRLPESIGKLQSLKYMYLNNNQLTSLPQTIGDLQSLRDLYIDNNPLTSLPPSFLELRLDNKPLDESTIRSLIRANTFPEQAAQSIQRKYKQRFKTKKRAARTIQRKQRQRLTRRKKRMYDRYRGMTGYNPVELEDQDISEYLFDDPKNFVIKMGDSYDFLNVTSEHIMNSYQFRGQTYQKVLYECNGYYPNYGQYTDNELVDMTEYIKLGAYKYVVLLPEWLRRGSPVSIPEPKIFRLVPLRRAKSMISSDYFFGRIQQNEDYLGADHCNEREGVMLYKLVVIDDEIEMDETARFLEEMSMYGGYYNRRIRR
jgi:Leucine-rich repeat (LRR) protein